MTDKSSKIPGLLVVVPCGKKKIWDKDPAAGPSAARDCYTGSPFIVNRSFAERFGQRWVILSAKYGFIAPDFELPGPYNVSFKYKSPEPVSENTLRQQVRTRKLGRFEHVIGLGGKEYRAAIEAAFRDTTAKLHFPFAGLRTGKAMQATNQAIATNSPFGPRKTTTVHSRESVISAIEEYDRLGRDAFLAQYGFRPAKNYFLVHNGKSYDSKAIVGVAYGYENPARGPLRSSDFVGGANTVQKWLERLGFSIQVSSPPRMTARPAASVSQPSAPGKSSLAAPRRTGEDVCRDLHRLLSKLPVHRFPLSMSQVPRNGIYVLFESGEWAHGTNRIVRIGTHTGANQLRSRLMQHFVQPYKDRSIFRKNIGRCLLSRDADPFLECWELDLTTSAAKAKYKDRIDFDKQRTVEQQVTEYMQRNFSFVVFEVPTKEERLVLESRIASTVSLCPHCRPTKQWLGRHSPKQKIRDSGLWQVNELYKTTLSPDEFATLSECVCG